MKYFYIYVNKNYIFKIKKNIINENIASRNRFYV